MNLTRSTALAIVGAAATILAFFLPWASYEKATYSAAALAAALGLDSPGLKGFGIALVLVPLLAAFAAAMVLTASGRTGEASGRVRLWAACAAIAGLALTLLFLGSAVLGGAPGVDFALASIRTDNAIKAAAAKALGAGAFTGLGAGVYLAIAGLLALVLGAIGFRGPAAERSAWRTQDLVLLAILAFVFGAVYWAWLQPYLWITGVAGQPGAELLFGLWLVGGLLGGYVIRRPGAAFLGETLAAAAEVLLGAPAGPILIVTGMMQALGAELVFAATGYRRWGWATMIVAGVVAALVALPWNWFRLGYFALDPALILALVAVRIVSGGLAGSAAKVLGDVVAATGSLNQFALGRERVREV